MRAFHRACRDPLFAENSGRGWHSCVAGATGLPAVITDERRSRTSHPRVRPTCSDHVSTIYARSTLLCSLLVVRGRAICYWSRYEDLALFPRDEEQPDWRAL